MEKVLLRKLLIIEGSNNHRCLMRVLDRDPCGIMVVACDMVDNVEHSLSITEEEMRNASITRHVSSLNDLLRSIQIVGKGTTAVLKSIIENIGGKECVHDEMDCTTSEQIGDIDSESVQELLVAGLLDLCKLKLVGNDAIKWLGDWLIANNPKKLNRSDPEKMQSDIDPSLK